ncbi:MAG: glycosyltransferase [Candidatus Aenigmarchaeota archaeon]|nr:glycosyltransferase [Candidatus Aenigmarchaeota archaeon]
MKNKDHEENVGEIIKKKKVAVVIPCLNEEKGIKKVLKKIPPFVDKVIVVDNNSTDNTAKIAKESNAVVLFEGKKGKGNAFNQFMKYYSNGFDADFVVMLDGDDTYDAREMKKIVEPLCNGSQVVVGNRFASDNIKGIMSDQTYWGNKFLTTMAKLLYGKDPKDVCTGYWGFSKEFLNKAKIKAEGFDLEANLFAEVARNKLNLGVVPINYRSRVGESKLKYSHGFLIMWRLLRNKISS